MTIMLDPPRPAVLDDARVSEATYHAASELGRADTKSGMMLALAGAFGAGLGAAEAAILTHPTVPSLAAYGTGVALALVGGAVDQLLRAVRPRLDGEHGIVAYSTAATDADAARMVMEQRPGVALLWSSRAAVGKYRRLGRAAKLLTAALYVTAATAVATVVLTLVG